MDSDNSFMKHGFKFYKTGSYCKATHFYKHIIKQGEKFMHQSSRGNVNN